MGQDDGNEKEMVGDDVDDNDDDDDGDDDDDDDDKVDELTKIIDSTLDYVTQSDKKELTEQLKELRGIQRRRFYLILPHLRLSTWRN